MGKAFSVARVKVISDGADAAPNTTPPASGTFQTDASVAGKQPVSFQFYGSFENVGGTAQDAAGVFTYTAWVQDPDNTSVWIKIGSGASIAHRTAEEILKVHSGEVIYIQLTAMTSSQTHLRLRGRTV